MARSPGGGREQDSLPEWSKGVDSSSTSASCVGSNPTAVSLQMRARLPCNAPPHGSAKAERNFAPFSRFECKWGASMSLRSLLQAGRAMSRSISGLVVEYIVAIDVTRVRFPADAPMALRGQHLCTNARRVLACPAPTSNEVANERGATPNSPPSSVGRAQGP